MTTTRPAYRGKNILVNTGKPSVSSQINLSQAEREAAAKRTQTRRQLEDLQAERANRDPWEVSRG